MTTYEHGKQPDGAPVTYTLDKHGFIRTFTVDGADDPVMASAIESPRLADRICRAFHLAQLAEEADAMLRISPLTPPGTTDWLRRYREAKQ